MYNILFCFKTNYTIYFCPAFDPLRQLFYISTVLFLQKPILIIANRRILLTLSIAILKGSNSWKESLCSNDEASLKKQYPAVTESVTQTTCTKKNSHRYDQIKTKCIGIL